jgi:hypothetical protein
LLIIKSPLLAHFLESLWLKQFILQLNPHIVFSFKKNIFIGNFAKLGFKKKDVYVLPKRFQCMLTTISFDL